MSINLRKCPDLSAAGFSLPDRDYYLKPDDRFKEARAKYVEHIAKMFTLAGWDAKSAAAAGQTVMTMETTFAEASLDRVVLRDPTAVDHNTTFAQLQALAPHFDWANYFHHKQLPQDVDMNVDQPKFMQEFDRRLQQTSIEFLHELGLVNIHVNVLRKLLVVEIICPIEMWRERLQLRKGRVVIDGSRIPQYHPIERRLRKRRFHRHDRLSC